MVNQYSHHPDRELVSVNGMPGLLDRNARVLLLDSGATVVICHRDQLSFHELKTIRRYNRSEAESIP